VTDEEETRAKVTVVRVETEPGVVVLEIKPVYSLKTVAKIMDIESVTTINRYVKDGLLKAFWTKAGKRVNHDDLQEFLDAYYKAPKPSGNIHKINEARERRAREAAQEAGTE
jgi:hypothetical protein